MQLYAIQSSGKHLYQHLVGPMVGDPAEYSADNLIDETLTALGGQVKDCRKRYDPQTERHAKTVVFHGLLE